MKKIIEYKIDTVNSLITKVKGGYKIDSTSSKMPLEYCNDSCVSNVEFFKTIKECKRHADKISIKCI